MKRSLFGICLAALVLPLAACATDGDYGPGRGPLPWYAWYDGFYGPVYDGYWGTDGFFYYRLGAAERAWRRGAREHFRREQVPLQGNFHRFEGTMQLPPPQTHAPRIHTPHIPREVRPRGEGQGRHPHQP